MSDVTNEELKELIERIHEIGDIDVDTIRQWSREDIERLLNAAHRKAEDEAAPAEVEVAEKFVAEPAEEIVVETEAVPEESVEESVDVQLEENRKDATMIFESLGDFSEEPDEAYKPDERIKDIMNGEAEKKKDFKSVLKNAKGKFSAFTKGLKKSSEKLAESMKNSDSDIDELDDFDEDEFEPADGEDITEEDDSDMKIADFSDKDKPGNEAAAEDKTVLIEKPGIVIKKGEADSDEELEGAPIIMSADDALADEAKIPTINRMKNDLKSKLREAEEDGQIILSGFDDSPVEEESPEEIDEDKAERELFEKRKKKIDNFVLFGDDDDDPYGSESEKEKLGELFDTHDDRPHRRETKKFDGVEYEQTKDARRVQRYINSLRKKSLQKVASLSAITVLSVITAIAASAKTYVGGDRFLTIFISLILIIGAIVISSQEIIESFQQLKKKQINLNTLTNFSAVLCFVQTFLMLILYFFDANTVSVFACTGVGLLLIGSYANYVVTCRTYDAMEFCTGDNKDKLYSIESIADDKDVLEFGKYAQSKSPRIRYSCKTRFPSHLVEMCTGETSVDKRARLLFMIIGIMSVINLIIGWVVNGNFAVGFSAMTITFALCVPAYAALLIQLPLRWVNKSINRKGAMITGQDAVSELYRTNAIILDSKDLFDKDECEMLGFKDFKNVRMDDAMLYAAAMVIRSGGPLTGVFDQMVVNRRDILPTVKSFSYEEKMGVSGWIYNQKVILGNRSMMINHNVEIPSGVDEDKYLMRGNEVMYLAIAHKLAAMIVVNYAPNRKIASYLKKLRDSGVSVLVRNCDPNVTERMISLSFDMRLDNIKIISSASGRVFKKYKARPKVATRAVCIHDGSTYTFIESLCTAASLRHTFKISDLMTYIGIGMSFAIVLILSALNVIADLPAIFVILMQAVIAGAFIGVTKISSGK
ncbi:MAG: hypothetical protein MJ168_10255 [Clostridia bacterium]|nr:hypothetical protein [Clostridia bacterium]